MKRQYVFLLLIFTILYILYLIVSYKYKEYRINTQIEYLATLKIEIEASIEKAEWIISYKSTIAQKNKVNKEEQGLKNKSEQVVYLTTEEKFNKYTKPSDGNAKKKTFEDVLTTEQKLIKEMSNYEKWMYFLFKKKTS